MSTLKIKVVDSNSKWTLDTDTTLDFMQQSCPNFFKTKFGKRETYSTYRGQLIVRNTRTLDHGFGNKRSFRDTTVYLFLVATTDKTHRVPDFMCVSAGNEVKGVAQAKKLIDRILGCGWYAYDMDKRQRQIDAVQRILDSGYTADR